MTHVDNLLGLQYFWYPNLDSNCSSGQILLGLSLICHLSPGFWCLVCPPFALACFLRCFPSLFFFVALLLSWLQLMCGLMSVDWRRNNIQKDVISERSCSWIRDHSTSCSIFLMLPRLLCGLMSVDWRCNNIQQVVISEYSICKEWCYKL